MGLADRFSARARWLHVGALNVAVGYALFAAALAFLGGGPSGFLIASWIAWALVVPFSALTMKHLAYRNTHPFGPQLLRALFIYLPAQLLASVVLWACVALAHMPALLGALAAVAVGAMLGAVAQRAVRLPAPFVVGEVPPEEFVRPYRIPKILAERKAYLGRVLHDAAHLREIISAAKAGGPRPYVFLGLDYHRASAGIRAWHRVIHELNQRGLAAYSLNAVNPALNERAITPVGFWALRRYGDPVAVYPEVISGNPLRAKHVARWVLNTPGHLGGDTHYPESELVFAWMRRYYDTDRILMAETIETELFNAENLPAKDIDCAYLGKAEHRGVEELPETHELIHITRHPHWPDTREELAALLRRTATLFTYDDCTMIIDEALLCGCHVVLLPERRELTVADTAGRLRQAEYDEQLSRFVELTQSPDW